MIKVGIIGCGYVAKIFHIPLINCIDSMQLVAISSSKYDSVQARYANVAVFNTAQALISSGLIDLAVITTPNRYHFSLAKLCLQHNINVIIEKPMTNTAEEARQLIRLAKERALLLSVFHNRRWDGDYLTVKKILQNKLLGEIKFFESHFDRFRPIVKNRWREIPGLGSGIWYDLGSHLVDQTVKLFGTPQALTARCLPMRQGANTADYFHVLLHYDNFEAVLHASSFTTAPNNRFRIEGTLGNYSKYGLDPQESQLQSGLTPQDKLYGCEDKKQYGRLYSENSSTIIKTEKGCYQKYYQEVAKALKDDADNPVSPADSVITLHILELAEKSNDLGKTLPLVSLH